MPEPKYPLKTQQQPDHGTPNHLPPVSMHAHSEPMHRDPEKVEISNDLRHGNGFEKRKRISSGK